jgi:hypothetical protein
MFGFLPNIGPWELIAILAIVLIIFGPAKLFPSRITSFFIKAPLNLPSFHHPNHPQ